ncbi:high mobility group protein B3-like [Choloepus didactylus]|uniref:high mobility group protein B3-like n=1 Tax=Choloepus didactylus TaxID=27675 RepID=UPI00189EAD3B|nr:high mobility group protein B3-like [Choloepus didactylus]
MAKGDPKKPKRKMSAYAFFVQMCREEHKKKNPEVPVNFAEFSKKCSEKWKTMSGKKSKFDEMAKADKVRYNREMKDYGPAKGDKKKDPNAPKRPPSGFFLFCSEFRAKIKSTNPGISIGDVAKKLGEMWNNMSDNEKQPYNNKAAKLKEKYEKGVADSKCKGKFDGAKGPAKVARKKVEEEDEEEEEEEEEEELKKLLLCLLRVGERRMGHISYLRCVLPSFGLITKLDHHDIVVLSKCSRNCQWFT